MKWLSSIALILGVIALDQGTKLWTHFTMTPGFAGEIHLIGDLLKLHYITNPGMAFGIEVGSAGKWVLSVTRLLIVAGMGYYLYCLIQMKYKPYFIRCLCIVMGGAVGNLIDSLFYGVWLNNAPATAPTPWFYGQVVDMIYIDIWKGVLPAHWPLIGGSYWSLWPIFNIADASIFIGVCAILFSRPRQAPVPKPSDTL